MLSNERVKPMGDLSEHEKLIERYISEDNKEAAVELLYGLIIELAKEKRFDQAEALRDWLFEVDSMALGEIVNSGEIIETEKSKAIDIAHLDTWCELYDNLELEEINALYYGLQPVEFPAGRMLFQQGDICSRLYFVEKGQLNMFCRQAEKSTLLKTFGAGDIIGEDTFFFCDAICTTSVITDAPSKLSVLEKTRLAQLNEKAPGLEHKLKNYCLELESVAELLKAESLERRQAERFNMPGKVNMQYLDAENNPTGVPLRGELLDISDSGLAFIIKTTKDTAAMMLRRKMTMDLSFAELETDLEFNRTGTVVAVSSQPFNEYFIHAQFADNLDPVFLDELQELRHLTN